VSRERARRALRREEPSIRPPKEARAWKLTMLFEMDGEEGLRFCRRHRREVVHVFPAATAVARTIVTDHLIPRLVARGLDGESIEHGEAGVRVWSAGSVAQETRGTGRR